MIWPRSEQEKESEPLLELLHSWVKWFLLYQIASFLRWDKASLSSQPSPPSIYSLMLPHPLQDLARMSREKHRGRHVFIKHIPFQLVSQNKMNTSRSIWGHPFLTILQHFKGKGTVLSPHGSLNKIALHSSKPSVFLFQFCQGFPIPRNRNSEHGGGWRVLAQKVVQMLFLKEDDHDCLWE